MSKRSVFVFFSGFILSVLCIQGLFYFLKEREKISDAREIKLIHETVKDRFRLFLNLPRTVTLLGAEYFSEGDFKTKSYGPFNLDLLEGNKEILGLNLVNENGEIIRVFPQKTNQHAIGRITQNYPALIDSWNEKRAYWLSSPFELYQKQTGFAFYAPIIEKERLQGWFATVISSHEFFNQFRLTEVLDIYELNIKDAETGKSYFSSGLDEQTEGLKSTVMIENRTLIFKCWRKKNFETYIIPWYVCFIVSTLAGCVALFIFHLWEHRRRIKHQLRDIRILLKLTSHEAVTKLIELKTTPGIDQNDLSYLSHLLEQVDLLQTMASSELKHKNQKFELFPLILNQLDELKVPLEKKNIRIIFDRKAMENLTVLVNQNLIEDSVLHHVLVHLAVYTSEKSAIEIFSIEKPQKYFLIFHSHHITGPEAFQTDRRFEVAKKVMNLCGGSLTLENSDSHGMLIKLEFPVTMKVDRSLEK